MLARLRRLVEPEVAVCWLGYLLAVEQALARTTEAEAQLARPSTIVGAGPGCPGDAPASGQGAVGSR